MSNELERLRMIAFDLREIGMLQTAGDIDYLVSWLKSPEFNNGEHLAPHPAGENTKDPYSNTCPIPFTPSISIIQRCTDWHSAIQLIQSAKDIINDLSGVYTDSIEQTAVKVYLEYSNKVISLLGCEVQPPTDPEPPQEQLSYSIGGTMAITDEGISSSVYASNGFIGIMNKGLLTQSINIKSFNSCIIADGGSMNKNLLTQSINVKSLNSCVIADGGSMNKNLLTQSINVKSLNSCVISDGGSMTIETEE